MERAAIADRIKALRNAIAQGILVEECREYLNAIIYNELVVEADDRRTLMGIGQSERAARRLARAEQRFLQGVKKFGSRE